MTRQAALTAEKEATDTESQYQQANAAMATYKASQTAWKACQATEAAGEAEGFANEAASHARNARTAAALDHALGAAQAYNEVHFLHLLQLPKAISFSCVHACNKASSPSSSPLVEVFPGKALLAKANVLGRSFCLRT